MFGRLPQPSAELNLISYLANLDTHRKHLTLKVGLVAVNLGVVVGSRPYLTILTGAFPQSRVTVRASDPKYFAVRQGPLPTFSVVGVEDMMLLPGAAEHLCDLTLDVPITMQRPITLEGTLGVLGAPPIRFVLSATGEEIALAIDRARTEQLQSLDVIRLTPMS